MQLRPSNVSEEIFWVSEMCRSISLPLFFFFLLGPFFALVQWRFFLSPSSWAGRSGSWNLGRHSSGVERINNLIEGKLKYAIKKKEERGREKKEENGERGREEKEG